MSTSSMADEIIDALKKTIACLEAGDAVAAADAVERAGDVWQQAVKAGVEMDSASLTAISELHKRCSEISTALRARLGDSMMQVGASRRAIGAYGGGLRE